MANSCSKASELKLTYSRLLILALLQRIEEWGDSNLVQDDIKSEEEVEIVYDESTHLLSGKNGGKHS
nr:hypothetical protein [Tanacetum cinerariifolium]